MTQTANPFAYTSDRDRLYGAAGMAIALMVSDAHRLLRSVNIDSPSYAMIEMDPEFYHSGHPEMSAKASWTAILNNFDYCLAMTLGNILCRSLSGVHPTFTPAQIGRLRTIAREEAAQTLSLETDEVDRMFEQMFRQLSRVFTHHGVLAVAEDFATLLSRRRTLSRAEVAEALYALNRM